MTDCDDDISMRGSVRSLHPTDRKTAAAAAGLSGKNVPFAGNCRNCGKPGHMRRDCPSLSHAERAKLHKASNARKEAQKNGGGGKNGKNSGKADKDGKRKTKRRANSQGGRDFSKSKSWKEMKQIVAFCAKRMKDDDSSAPAAVASAPDCLDTFLSGVGAMAIPNTDRWDDDLVRTLDTKTRTLLCTKHQGNSFRLPNAKTCL